MSPTSMPNPFNPNSRQCAPKARGGPPEQKKMLARFLYKTGRGTGLMKSQKTCSKITPANNVGVMFGRRPPNSAEAGHNLALSGPHTLGPQLGPMSETKTPPSLSDVGRPRPASSDADHEQASLRAKREKEICHGRHTDSPQPGPGQNATTHAKTNAPATRCGCRANVLEKCRRTGRRRETEKPRSYSPKLECYSQEKRVLPGAGKQCERNFGQVTPSLSHSARFGPSLDELG